MEINDDNILDQADYREIIYNSLNPIHDSIGDYFFMKYNEYKSINHSFSKGLEKAIEKIKKDFFNDVEAIIKPNIKSPQKVNWNDFSFYLIDNKLYYDFQIEYDYWEFPYPRTEKSLIKKRLTINKLNEGYDYFISLIKDLEMDPGEVKIKLNWVLNKNQLYMLIKELKRIGAINNTYEQLSIFLKENISAFEETSRSTILKELSRDVQPPKNKRITIKIGEEGKK